MPKSVIFINTQGLDGMIEAMRIVQRPNFLVTHSLETVLKAAFKQTQEDVHVISGRLKDSGHTETDFDGVTWEGSINYGGPQGTPAYYAIYEMGRSGIKHGTPHDFFAGLEEFDGQFEEAIDSHFKILG